MDFAVSADHRIKLKENEKKDKYFDLARELRKPWNMKVMVLTIVICSLDTVPKWLLQSLEDLEIKRMNGGHPNYCIIEIIQYTEKSPRDLGRLESLKLQWQTIS